MGLGWAFFTVGWRMGWRDCCAKRAGPPCSLDPTPRGWISTEMDDCKCLYKYLPAFFVTDRKGKRNQSHALEHVRFVGIARCVWQTFKALLASGNRHHTPDRGLQYLINTQVDRLLLAFFVIHPNPCIHPCVASRIEIRSLPARTHARSRSPAALDGSEEGSPPPRSRTPSQAPPTWPAPLDRSPSETREFDTPLRPRAWIGCMDWAGPCDVIHPLHGHGKYAHLNIIVIRA